MKRWNLFTIALFILPLMGLSQSNSLELLQELNKYCQDLPNEFDQIPEERKESLKELGEFISEKRTKAQPAKLTVICTHNSRRSHIGQLWLETATAWYGLKDVHAYSGGTEATAFNQNAIDALKRAGFKFTTTLESKHKKNQVHEVAFAAGNNSENHLLMFSKKYDYTSNPKAGFAAIMVCSDADQKCPIVPGAEARIAIPFNDPRHSDGTSAMEKEYDKTVRLIAREMFFAMNHAKKQLASNVENK